MINCILDMDGVLTDLHRGVIERFDFDPFEIERLPKPLPWDWAIKTYGISSTIWRDLDAEFWEYLHWTMEGEEILERVLRRYKLEHVLIVSNPSKGEGAYIGKLRWLERHLPGVEHMLGRAKYFFAHGRSILVDDHDENCLEFSKHGGDTILIPRAWNRLHAVNTLEYVRKMI